MLKSLAEALAHAHVNWVPEKHPRGRDGKFIEVGDKVKVFDGPTASAPSYVGTVKAGHLAPDGRMFIGVEDEMGTLSWFRPKQIEQINAKATLTPTKPLPDIGHKATDIQWQEDQPKPFEPGEQIASVTQLDNAPVGSKMSYKSGLGLDTYTKNENGDWMTDSASPYPSSDFEGPISSGHMYAYTPPKQLHEGDYVDSYVDMDALPVGTQVQMSGTDYAYTKTAEKGVWKGAYLPGFGTGDEPTDVLHTSDFFKTDGSAKDPDMGVNEIGDGTFDGKKPMTAQDVTDADQGSIVSNYGTTWTKITDDEWESEDGTTTVSTDEMAQEAAKGHVIADLEHHLDDGMDLEDGPPLTWEQAQALPKGAVVKVMGTDLTKDDSGEWANEGEGVVYNLKSYIDQGTDVHLVDPGTEPQLEDNSQLEDWEKELLAPITPITDYNPDAPGGLHAGDSPKNIQEFQALPIGTQIKNGSSPYVKVANGGPQAWLYTNSHADEPKYYVGSQGLYGNNGDLTIKVTKVGDGSVPSDGELGPLSLEQLYSAPIGTKIDWNDAGGDTATFQKVGDDAWSVVGHDGSVAPTTSKTSVFKTIAADGNVTMHAEEPQLENPSPPGGELGIGDTVLHPADLEELPEGTVIKTGYKSGSTLIKNENGNWIDSDYPNGNGYESSDLFDPDNAEPYNTITIAGMPAAKPSSGLQLEEAATPITDVSQLKALPIGTILYMDSKTGPGLDGKFKKLPDGKWTGDDGAGNWLYDNSPLSDEAFGGAINKGWLSYHPPNQPTKPETPALVLPPGKTPADLLQMIYTSAENKGLSPVQLQTVQTRIDLALDPSITHTAAHKHLAVAMTAAKLGGKQRAKYKQLLNMHHGVPVEAGFAAPKPNAPAVGAQTQLLPNGLPAINGMVKPQGASVTPLTKANSMTQSGGETPQQAKSAIQLTMVHKIAHIPTEQIAALADSPTYKGNDSFKQMTTAWRIMQKKQSGKALTAAEQGTLNTWTSGNFVLVKNSGHWQFTNAKGYHSNGVPVDAANLDRAIRETAVASMIQLWAATSNDQNPRSLAMQMAADREFDLQGAAKWNPSSYHSATNEKANKEADDEYARYGKTVFQPFLRGMYENTQEWLKAHGVTHVVLRRGMSGVSGFYKGETGSVTLRPLNSFSSNLAVAKRFGGGVVIEAVIPAERIIGGSSTGFGCRGEYEYVVLGGTDLYRRYK